MRTFSRSMLYFVAFIGALASVACLGMAVVCAVGNAAALFAPQDSPLGKYLEGASPLASAVVFLLLAFVVGFVPALIGLALEAEDHLDSIRRDVAGIARLRSLGPSWEPLKG